jgi:U11/U12 small nuclear ribonucleoprotein SNRNP65
LQIKILTGRLAGSALVTLPSVELAERALSELHGYLLRDKPMILEYGKR